MSLVTCCWIFGFFGQLVSSTKLSTIAYFPEYRHGYDIEAAARSGMLTDVVLFSVEVSKGGGISGVERLPSQGRVAKLRSAGVKVHVCIGGAGRSAGFSSLLHAEARAKTVRRVVKLIQQWSLDGVDVDWEVPHNEGEWRALGNFLKDIRRAWSKFKNAHVSELVLSFTLWPHDVTSMLAAKAGQKTLVDFADRIHMMTYSGDEKKAVSQWEKANLPLSRLAFGVRFFFAGTKPYYEIPDSEMDSKRAKQERQRVQDASFFATQKGLAGVFIWEIGQDRTLDKHSLLQSLHQAVEKANDAEL